MLKNMQLDEKKMEIFIFFIARTKSKMDKTPNAQKVVLLAAPEIEHRRRRRPRERRLKAGKMLRWSIFERVSEQLCCEGMRSMGR